MNKILILNGPPGSGKDAVANCLQGSGMFIQHEFKATLHDIAISMSGMSRTDYFRMYSDRDIKETPQDSLFGFSPRNFLIHISEVLCKPYFGKDYFGIRAAKDILANLELFNIVFSDGGFPDEVNVLSDTYGIDNVKIIHLYRKGCTFKGDPRDYVLEEDTGIKPTIIYNDDTIRGCSHRIQLCVLPDLTPYARKYLKNILTTQYI